MGKAAGKSVALALLAAGLIAAPTTQARRHAAITHVDRAAHGARAAARPRATAAVAGRSMLPAQWCGNPRALGDPGALAVPGAASVQLVYAYPADAPNRVGQVADMLQGNVSIIDRFIASESGGRKTVRFAMGTSCGPQYADIVVLPLKGPRMVYQALAGAQELLHVGPIVTEVRAGLPHDPPGQRNYLVFVDGVADLPSGFAEATFGADVPGRANPNNVGGRLAFVVGGALGGGADSYEPLMFLHELTHTLGAVQLSAPHATPGGHCYDGLDVMCYPDGTGPPPQAVCPSLPGPIDRHFDCGGDDYFNPQPAPGSYLATHFNVYESPFLAGCNELPAACAAAPESPASPPAAVTPGGRHRKHSRRWLSKHRRAGSRRVR
jgi:hypothetical protein